MKVDRRNYKILITSGEAIGVGKTMLINHMIYPLIEALGYERFGCDIDTKELISAALDGLHSVRHREAFINSVAPEIFSDFVNYLGDADDAPVYDKVIVPIDAASLSSKETMKTFQGLITAGIDLETVYVVFTNVLDKSKFDTDFKTENKVFLNSLHKMGIQILMHPILRSDIYARLDAKKSDNYVACKLGKADPEFFEKLLKKSKESGDPNKISESEKQCRLFIDARASSVTLNNVFTKIFKETNPE